MTFASIGCCGCDIDSVRDVVCVYLSHKSHRAVHCERVVLQYFWALSSPCIHPQASCLQAHPHFCGALRTHASLRSVRAAAVWTGGRTRAHTLPLCSASGLYERTGHEMVATAGAVWSDSAKQAREGCSAEHPAMFCSTRWRGQTPPNQYKSASQRQLRFYGRQRLLGSLKS